jgi:hypothetical protein
MFSVKSGTPIAIVEGGVHDGEILGVTDVADPHGLASDIEFKQGALEPILDIVNRSVEYIAGPSGSGKSTYVAGLVKRYIKLNEGAEIYLFSRGMAPDDPAFDEILPAINQVVMDSDLVKSPPDVTKMSKGAVLIFDDVGTIIDDTLKRSVQKIIMDCAEVGRKYGIYMLVTSHLIIPNERNFARVMMNEMQFLTVFPGSGGTHQITYVLKKYMGFDAKQVKRILESKSRWVRVHSHAPRWVLEEKAAYVV